MKKLLLSVALVAATGVSASAAGNVYASQLKSEGAKVTFVLNQPAEEVIVSVLDAQGNVLKSKLVGAGVKGLNTVDLAGMDVADGDYKWQVTCQDQPVTEVTCLTSDKPAALNITNSRGLGIDTWQDSPYFGRIYVTSTSGARPGERNKAGIYILDADFSELSEDPFTGGQTWSGASGPNNLKVSEDGVPFVCDWTDGHAGVWTIDPADPSADFKPVFGGGDRDSNGLLTVNGVKVSGSIQDIALYGKGTDRMLYTTDEDINNNTGDIFVYNIGLLIQPWSVAPTASWGNNGGKLANANHRLGSDRRGGLWVSQYRWEEAEAYPVLGHLNAQGVWDFSTGDKSVVVGSGPAGAMAVNVDGSLIAVADNGHEGGLITVISATYDAEGVPTLTQLYTFKYTGYGNRPMGLAFDAANNLYGAFNNDAADGGIGVWALPNENNSYTTVAIAPVSITAGIDDVTVDADENGVAEYYDLMGRKVAEPQQGRVYIERRGSKATKVVF